MRLDRVNVFGAVVVVALVVRIAFVIAQNNFSVFEIYFDAGDSSFYRDLADSLVSGDGLGVDGRPTAFVTPGYPLFLGLLYLISSGALFIGIVQAVVGAVTVGLLAAIAFRFGGRPAAWAAGLFAAVYPHLVFWTGYVLTETLYVFAVALALYLAVRTCETRSLAMGAAAGAAIGGAALVRPIALGFGVVVGIAGIVVPRYRRQALLGVSALLLVLAPWVIRNAVVMDAPIFTSTESGHVLWQGNSPGATGGTGGYVDAIDYEPLEIADPGSEAEIDRIYLEESLDWMRGNPGRVLALIPKKLWNMWRPTYAGASTLNAAATLVTYPLLLAGGAVGLWLGRNKGALAFLLVAFFVYHLIVHGLVTGMIRFRLPVEASLFPLFGLAVARFVKPGGS